MSPITQCVFPVAGFGTRFLPATKAIAKEMLPILAKPLIQYAVEEAAAVKSVKNMLMVTNKAKKSIENHFKLDAKLTKNLENTPKQALLDELNALIAACRFDYVEQTQMLGLGHAILSAKAQVEGAFAVILPDDLCVSDGKSVLAQMIALHRRYPTHCIVAIEPVLPENVNKYGIIAGNLIENGVFQVKTLIEKPEIGKAPSNLAVIGRYILTPEIFHALEHTAADKNGEIQLTDALMTLAKRGKVLGFQFEGVRFDCGSVKGFTQATCALAKAANLL